MTKSVQPIFYGDLLSLHQSNLYFSTDPMLSKTAWARNFLNPSAFSLCGLTHSIANYTLVEEIGKLILAPIKPWDAIICTSVAAKNVMQTIFQQWYDYLNEHRQLSHQSSLQLPVIPLGIHVNEVANLKDKPKWRKKSRQEWRIKENDFVILFYGRLSFYEKAHPIPMLIAIEEFAKRVGQNQSIHFIQAGWFEQSNDLNHYQQSAKQFCPSVNHIFLTNLDKNMKEKMWSCADVFISLVDNIQESFGLTPLEAMANELPVIVSDWDGYKDTVRHGIDGFRIPTILPPAGCGKDLALGYLIDAVNYQTYCGLNAQFTAIDIKSCVQALGDLFSSIDLRQQMGAAGRLRVMNSFDWKHIVKLYDELWDELSQLRLTAKSENESNLVSPVIADPFFTFSQYASMTLQANHVLQVTHAAKQRLNDLEKNLLCHFGAEQRLAYSDLLAILTTLQENGNQSVQQIIRFITKMNSTLSSGLIVRSLAYLLKYNLVTLCLN